MGNRWVNLGILLVLVPVILITKFIPSTTRIGTSVTFIASGVDNHISEDPSLPSYLTVRTLLFEDGIFSRNIKVIYDTGDGSCINQGAKESAKHFKYDTVKIFAEVTAKDEVSTCKALNYYVIITPYDTHGGAGS